MNKVIRVSPSQAVKREYAVREVADRIGVITKSL